MPQSNEQKEVYTPFYMGLLVIFVAFVLWYRFRAAIVMPLFYLDDGIYFLANYLGMTSINRLYWESVREVLVYPDYNIPRLQFGQLVAIQHNVGMLFRYVSAAALLGLLFLVMFVAPEDSMVRKFIFRGGKYGEKVKIFGKTPPEIIAGLPLPGKKKIPGFIPMGKDFTLYQSQVWRASVTSAYFDQYRHDPNWRTSDNELDLAHQAGVKRVSSLETPKLVEQLLLKQLTTPWEGILKAPVHAQAIAALVVLNRQRNLKKVAEFAGDLALCALPHREPDFVRMEELVKPVLTQKAVQALDNIGNRHAFLKTAMVGIYASGGPFKSWGGGRAGVLQPALFLWMKGVDRELWYALQCVGRATFFAEACAVLAHFKYERMLRKPVRVPYIKAAVGGLISTLKSMGIDDVEQYRSDLLDNMM